MLRRPMAGLVSQKHEALPNLTLGKGLLIPIIALTTRLLTAPILSRSVTN